MTDRKSEAPSDPLPRAIRQRLDAPVAAVLVLLAPLIGSVATGLVIAVAVIGFLRLGAVWRRIAIARPVAWTAAAFALFFLAEALAGLVNWNGSRTLSEIAENTIFLGLLPCYLLLARTPESLLDFLLRMAPLAAIGALALALLQLFWIGIRPEGGAGNAAVFAVTVSVVLAFCLANTLRSHEGAGLAFAIAGVVAAAATLILSGTRSLWPCLVLFPAALWFVTAKMPGRPGKPVLLAVVAILLLSLALGGMIRDRYDEALSDIVASESGEYQTSIGKRMVVWKVALGAIAERPLLGHGPDSPRRLMRERTAQIGGEPVIFNHFHDFLLNEMVRSGAVGTLAMLSMLFVPLGFGFAARGDATARYGFGLLLCFQGAYVLSGIVGIMLDHDIMDAQFVAWTALCLYLMFPSAARSDGMAGDDWRPE